ncbi:unnamed protein product [Cyprideis torosa]|uniref:5-formyltetrahydrofolate cyclo-ligase n=1 Tax=Cyprideis torosa TaxID=163714 RepID=A0A7R8W9Y4_9CRUS|nr:unnamed protein product [Cyprideis torosa]CAG0887804.1 unnamed protein product [Cyprideis torosa]
MCCFRTTVPKLCGLLFSIRARRMSVESIRQSKAVLRKVTSAKLKAMTPAQVQTFSQAVVEQVLQHDKYLLANRIACFISMPDEVDTTAIIKDVFERSRELFIPRYHTGSNRMDMLSVGSMVELQSLPETSWGIKQHPTNFQAPDALQTGCLDLILVPGLAFTVSGHRLGRGKGYYDTYLKRALQSANPPVTMGLCFDQQVVDSIPVTPDDVTIQYIVTPSSRINQGG